MSAIGADATLSDALVLKGAHAVEALTGRSRSTLDIDLTARFDFVPRGARGNEGKEALKASFHRALERFSEETSSEWSVRSVSAEPKPSARRPHRFGWDGFGIKVTLQFRRKHEVVVEIDLSFDDFTDGTVCVSWVRASSDGLPTVQTEPGPGLLLCYSIEQAVAEKLRAWLQKLPAHLEKIGATADRLRVRDLRDIHVLVFSSVGAIDYASVGDSFVRKCQKRLVDCSSIDDVLPATVSLEDLRAQYDDDRALADVAFDDAVATVRRLVSRLDELGRLPGIVPLPE
jgi:hypothetical protein